jgi:nucleoside diphosphate kinase
LKEASTVNIISPTKEEIQRIIDKLEKSGLTVVATSGVILDRKTTKFHRFVSVNCNE